MNISNLEMAQASMEIFGGIVCLMICVFILVSKRTNKNMKLFNVMFFVAAVLLFSEAVAYICRGNVDAFSMGMTRAANFIVFLLNFVLLYLFVRFMYVVVGEQGIKADNTCKIIAYCCIAVGSLMVIVNAFTGWMYYFDESNFYHRNVGWYIYVVMALLCLIDCAVFLLLYKKAIGTARVLTLLLYLVFPIVAVGLQYFLYGISITTIGIAVGLLLMFIVYLFEWSKRDVLDSTEAAKKRRSIEISAMFSIMVVSMSASIFSCLISINRISSKMAEKDSQTVARVVAESISNEFLKPFTVAETMSNDFNLKKNMNDGDKETAMSLEKTMADYLESIKDGFDYQMVFAVSDKSKAYYTYDGISKFVDIQNDEHDIWYKNFLDSGKDYRPEIDTDEANNGVLSVFVNKRVYDLNGDFLGVCGVGLEMNDVKDMLIEYEERYGVRIHFVDRDGLVQIDTDVESIGNVNFDSSYFDEVDDEGFVYESHDGISKITRYMEDLDWYLIIEDDNAEKISVAALTTPSIIIFFIGLVMMAVAFIIISNRDQSTVRELMKKNIDVVTDDLTGLYNRRAFEEDSIAIRDSGRLKDISIVIMDLNGLKRVNDSLGHVAGDEMLIGAGKCITAAFGAYGRVYRIGGDEFAAILNCSSDKARKSLAELDEILENWRGKMVGQIAMSKGLVVCSDFPYMNFEEAKKLADRLMYDDKSEYYKKTGINRRRM